MRAVHTLAEIDALFAEGRALGDEAKRVELLCNVYYDPRISVDLDPFSDEYLQAMLKLHADISGNGNYSPETHELLGGRQQLDVAQLARQPTPYSNGVEITGDFLVALGFLMKTIAPKPGAAILEYGPGGGQLALFLARIGYDVTVVDIEPIYIEAIQRQADAIGVPITAMVGQFGETPDPAKRYDAVIFFEAFHHALRHLELLRRLQDVVAEGGVIALAGEPVHPKGSPWEVTVPFPWGPRCDALSLCAMRGPGWMELGFRESYLMEALARTGWQGERHVCPMTDRGTTYVVRRATKAAAKPAIVAQVDSTAPALVAAPAAPAASPVPAPSAESFKQKLRRWTGF